MKIRASDLPIPIYSVFEKTPMISMLKNEIRFPFFYYAFWLLSMFLSTMSFAESNRQYSPYAERDFPETVYWGDTHVHTNLSMDATVLGNKYLGQEEAYQFAKGGTVTAHNGMQVKLQRPLDFIVLAEHAFNLGLLLGIQTKNPLVLNTPEGQRLHELWSSIDPVERDTKILEYGMNNWWPFAGVSKNALEDDSLFRSVWQDMIHKADEHNEPGKFTAFIGYEWTSFKSTENVYPDLGNLHRVVLFKDDAKKVGKILPFSTFDSTNPEDLWKYLEQYQDITGGDVLAIPHNGNLSGGEMFSLVDFQGRALTKDYAKTRSRWEPLYEVTQMKGDGEAHPVLSPTDEFADYETWNSWSGENKPSWNEQKKAEYARSGLKYGLEQQAKLGVNSFKFGLIGSTDSHTSLATADDNNFWGKTSTVEPNPSRALKAARFSAGGYAAVWAKENTRESLFAAMKRKEVYASTGPRMEVRFFGGWDYQEDDAYKPDFAEIGYRKGVPMGGDLTSAPAGKSPTFLIRAVRDPQGANLDRVQVIKGWYDKTTGELHEKIYNVALSDNRKENWLGKVKPVGSTVNVEDASYTNTIGDPELSIVWCDPDFDKDDLAFYYLRVLEIPTPRWTAYDAKFFGLKDIPKDVRLVTQERAYSSSIWYDPY